MINKYKHKKINLNTQNNFNKIDSNYNNYDKKRIK